jgi:multidrug efflux pump subunit AcrA (membrane-fusion protein)
MSEASIYARAAGYVTKRYADIGDHVKANQLMAEIETPELDQQVAQAQAALAQARQQLSQNRASLVQAQAQRDIAKLTAQRYDSLVSRGAVARQDADQQESTWKSSEALVDAQQASVSAGEENVHQAQANLERVTALRDYNKVRAPVDGVVTARNIDVGYLISATGAGQGGSPLDIPGQSQPAAAGNEMYRIAQTGTLRILVNVPQSSAPGIAIGMQADVLVAEFPGRIFPGKVSRTSNSLDPNSRTLLTQVEIPNKDGKLYPGMYAQVRFRTHRDTPPLLIPGDALINSQAGSQVAVLREIPDQEARRIHLQTIQLGRDYGAQTEVLAGLEGGETIIVNPGDTAREGNLVKFELRGAGKK